MIKPQEKQKSTPLAGTLTVCQAIKACRILAEASNYHTFNVYEDSGSKGWGCLYNSDPQGDKDLIVDSDAGRSFAYSLARPCDLTAISGYKQFFQGYQYKISDDNNAYSITFPPTTTCLSKGDFVTACQAVTKCQQIAVNVEFYTFEVHELAGGTLWGCRIFYGADTDTSTFQTNTAYGMAYGYNLPAP